MASKDDSFWGSFFHIRGHHVVLELTVGPMEHRAQAPRWLVRPLVVLTALLCLGTAGYVGQVWWAKHLAQRLFFYSGKYRGPMILTSDGGIHRELLQARLSDWRNAHDSNLVGDEITMIEAPRWLTSKVWHQYFMEVTGQALPNAPDAWEAWFKAHPNLIWDEKRKLLLEAPKP
jgi:hypothetical protein